MIIHEPLELAEAKTQGLTLTPTKGFFKPVVVLIAPIEIEHARALQFDWIFDAKGNPQPFDKTLSIKGDLVGPELYLKGVNLDTRLICDKIAKFSIFVKEDAVMLRMRCHVPELPKANLLEFLEFLSTLNKDPFTVVISPAQGSLLEKLETDAKKLDQRPAVEHTYAEPDEAGLYPEARGARRPMGSKKVKAVVHTIELEQGFIGGWSVEWRGAEPTAAGEALSVRSTVYNAESEAIGAAASSIHAFVTSESFQLARIQGAAELKAVNSLISQLIDLNPALSPLHAGGTSADGNEARA